MGAGALTASFGAYAQPQVKVWRVGFLSQRIRPQSFDTDIFGAFLTGMRERGYVEGKNLAMEWRFAGGDVTRLPALAAELVQLKPDVIMTNGVPTINAPQKATTTIPIVFGNAPDPIANGWAKSLARPGGNLTGVSNLNVELSPKRLEMLTTMVPRLARVAVLVHPDNLSHATRLKSIQAAAKSFRVAIVPVSARNPQEIERAFAQTIKEKAGALIVEPDAHFNQQVRQITDLTVKHRLPAMFGAREYVELGGLMSYGSNVIEIYRRAATYVDKILKGAKPADLPIEQPTLLELVINGKTVKALGLKIPNSLLVTADKVIE
jgi:putative ABC transport system substrate-binding protein